MKSRGAWLVFLCMFSGAVQALTFNVNITTDSVDASAGDGACADAGGNCSLRAAVMQSNASGGSNIINIPAGTYALTIPSGSSDFDASVGDLDISAAVSLVGAGSATTTINASGMNHRAFQAPVDLLFFGAISFSGMTITGGNTTGLGGSFTAGAAVDVQSRFVTLASFVDVVITGNSGSSAIDSRADLSFTNSSISNNTGHGIFLTNDDAQIFRQVKELNMNSSTVEGNTVNGISIGNCDGGSLINSTISGNGVMGFQAQFTNNNDFIVTNSTIASNGRDGIAGIGFTIFDPVFGNTPVRPDILVRNTIIANNIRSDVTTPALESESEIPTSGGFNVVSDNSAAPNFTQPSDQNNTDPLLLAIALNSPGATRTHAISGTSPAIDMASASFAPATDQRGVTRPKGAADDVGAYEFEPTNSNLGLSKSADVMMASQGDPIEFTIVVSNAGPDAVVGATVSDALGTDFIGASWTCVATPGSSCSSTGSGDINDLVNLANAGTATYTLNVNLSQSAGGSAINLAMVSLPGGAADPNPSNNSDSVDISIPNTAPVANNDSYTLSEDGTLIADDADGTATAGNANDNGLLANDTDIDNDSLTVTSDGSFAATGIGGTVVLATDGTFTYSPPANVFGTDTFNYTVSDSAASDQGSVTIMVSAVNDQPLFTAGPSQHFASGTSGLQSLTNWVAGFDPGPNEGGQAVLNYNVSITDPDAVLNTADVLNNGTLELDLTGSPGTAQLDISAQDDGGTPGVDTSAVETVFVSVATNAEASVTATQCIDKTGPGFVHLLLLTVSNNGPDTATGVLVDSVLPADMSLASAQAAMCFENLGTVTCDLGGIDAASSTDVLLVLDVAPGAVDAALDTMVTVSALQPDSNMANNSDSITTTVVGSLVYVDGFENCSPAP